MTDNVRLSSRRAANSMPSVRFTSGGAEEVAAGAGGREGVTASILRNTNNNSNHPPPPPPTNSPLPGSPKKRRSFFTNLFSRKDEYHSDRNATAYTYATTVTSPGVGSTVSGNNNNNNNNTPTSNTTNNNATNSGSGSNLGEEDNGGQPKASASSSTTWIRTCCVGCGNYFRPSRSTLDRMSLLIVSRVWQILLVVFTILLLFGPQFQELWIPKEGDVAFDVLFSLAMVVFGLDIIFRCYTEPQYFGLSLCDRGGGDEAVIASSSSSTLSSSSAWGSCRVGSFMFWCDLISSLTLLYDISYINRRLFSISTIDIELNSIGLPISGLDDINRALPIELELELLITIGRTARVARFIRASTVVKTSSKVNWFWIYQRINPIWYLEKFRHRNADLTPLANMDAASTSSDGAFSSGGQKSNTNNNNLNSNSSAGGVAGSAVRHASWGGVQMGVLAAVKKTQLDEEKRKNGHDGGMFGSWGRALLRSIGLMRNDNEELRRHIAATRIQRAWRTTVNQHGRSASNEDVAWAPSREFGTPSPVTQKRSILRPSHIGSNYSNSKNPIKRSMLPMSVKNHIQARSSVGRRRPESQVGSAMRELTGQRVAIGIIIALVLTVLFTYSENDATRPSTMIVLHNQTKNNDYAQASLNAAKTSSIPDLYRYKFANNTYQDFEVSGEDPDKLRERERLKISVVDAKGDLTVGYFAYRNERRDEALVELSSTIFILLVWFFGVTAFAGPVMTLVVIPIERMVRLLGMLMLDPLGYQSTPRYKKFVAEEDELTKNTRWTKEVLKGMETSFLMSTILRIGSLMKVGFGSAGVEIIRNNLERGQSKNMLILNSQGSTVSCIFLFCDIRQFTDATECLQEEVFVFTNRIAAVVHSICHAYGGSANKNVGDAFLLSWLLEDESSKPDSRGRARSYSHQGKAVSSSSDTFTAKTNQADKALLSVVKICKALHHDDFYIGPMSETAREALLSKLKKRSGPVVQMGFGLHAGKAVQGAIGSQRKIDATYVSESVERAEFLESSTKKYGLKMLMSDSFHRLLHPSNRRRCRKVDQILMQNEDDDDDEAVYEGDVMELFTFDMDIDALWRTSTKKGGDGAENSSDTESINESAKGSKREIIEKKASTRQVPGGGLLKGPRRRSLSRLKPNGGDTSSSEDFKVGNSAAEAAAIVAASVAAGSTELGKEGEGALRQKSKMPPQLVLPSGPTLYNANVWLDEDMRKIRELFSDGLFFQKFNSGLQSYYARDWEHAKQCFQTILERFDDGPSRYFLKCIEENNGVPPRNFLGYGTA